MGAAQRWRRRAMLVHRVTVELDKPTRDGEAAIHILTNLPAEDADARIVAESNGAVGRSRPRSPSAWHWCLTT